MMSSASRWRCPQGSWAARGGGVVVQEPAPAGAVGPPGQAPDEDALWDRGRGGGRGCSCGGWSEALAVAPGVGEVWPSWLPAASV